MKHSLAKIAKIKGALQAGLGYNLVSERSGVPWETVKKYALGIRHKNVKPDRTIEKILEEWLEA